MRKFTLETFDFIGILSHLKNNGKAKRLSWRNDFLIYIPEHNVIVRENNKYSNYFKVGETIILFERFEICNFNEYTKMYNNKPYTLTKEDKEAEDWIKISI